VTRHGPLPRRDNAAPRCYHSARERPADHPDRRRREEHPHHDAALLDVRLRQGDSLEIARALRRCGVPFAVVSGYTRESLPPEMAAAPFLAKPLGEVELVEVARTLFTPL